MSGSGCVSLLCTYTSQKTKKRKTYADGQLLVDPNTRRVVLRSADENRLVKDALEVQFLSPQQIQALLRGACTELEMDGFLVSVDRHQPSASASTFAPSSRQMTAAATAAVVKPKRFKPPQRIAPPLQQQQQQQQPELSQRSDPYQRQPFSQVEAGGVVPPARAVVRGKYSVTEDELDDIWGTDNEATGSSYPEEGIDTAPSLPLLPQPAPRPFASATATATAAVLFEGRSERHEPLKQPQLHHQEERRQEAKIAAPAITTTENLWNGYFAPTTEEDGNADDEERAIDQLFATIPTRPRQPQAAPAPAPAPVPAPQISRATAPLPAPSSATSKPVTATKTPDIAPPQQRTTEDLLSLFG